MKGTDLSVSDIVRSKVTKNEKTIIKILKLIELVKFGNITVKNSTSNRNFGKEIYILKKYIYSYLISTAQGRARFNLFRLNRDLLDRSFD